jgi:hypothetical protein
METERKAKMEELRKEREAKERQLEAERIAQEEEERKQAAEVSVLFCPCYGSRSRGPIIISLSIFAFVADISSMSAFFAHISAHIFCLVVFFN